MGDEVFDSFESFDSADWSWKDRRCGWDRRHEEGLEENPRGKVESGEGIIGVVGLSGRLGTMSGCLLESPRAQGCPGDA